MKQKNKKWRNMMCALVELPNGKRKWYVLGAKVARALRYEQMIVGNRYWKSTLINNYIIVTTTGYHYNRALIAVGRVVRINYHYVNIKSKHTLRTRNQFATRNNLIHNPEMVYNYLKHDYRWFNKIRIKYYIKKWNRKLTRENRNKK